MQGKVRIGMFAAAIGVAVAGCADEAPAVSGYWLWDRMVEDGTVVRTITDADMAPAVGPSGWPDCPGGILCTRWGIQKIALGDGGNAHYIHNVHTSSDFHQKGSYAVEGDELRFRFAERFSCAHPEQRDTERREGRARWRLEGDELWLSVPAFDSSYPFVEAVPEEPTRWVVYRRITPEEFENRYMIRLCQAASDDGCHPDCFPERLGMY